MGPWQVSAYVLSVNFCGCGVSAMFPLTPDMSTFTSIAFLCFDDMCVPLNMGKICLSITFRSFDAKWNKYFLQNYLCSEFRLSYCFAVMYRICHDTRTKSCWQSMCQFQQKRKRRTYGNRRNDVSAGLHVCYVPSFLFNQSSHSTLWLRDVCSVHSNRLCQHWHCIWMHNCGQRTTHEHKLELSKTNFDLIGFYLVSVSVINSKIPSGQNDL